MTTPLFNSASFPTVGELTPSNADTSAKGSGAVEIIQVNGVTQTIFDSVNTGLRVQQYMHLLRLYSMHLSENIVAISVGPKLLIFDTDSMINQKVLALYTFRYESGQVRGVGRNQARSLTLMECYLSVGWTTQHFSIVGQEYVPSEFQTNFDLETQFASDPKNKPFVILFDYYYQSSKAVDLRPFLNDVPTASSSPIEININQILLNL